MSPHFTAQRHTVEVAGGPQGHLDRVPLPRGVKFKTTFIITKNAFLSASAHLTLIMASFQRREAIKLGWVLHTLSPLRAVLSTVSWLDTALIYGKVEFIFFFKQSTRVGLRATIPKD